MQSLVPDAIARQVLGYLTQFAGKASRLGAVGLAVLLVTALALVLTIDRTLNSIWRVQRPRPLAPARADLLGGDDAGPAAAGGQPEHDLLRAVRVARPGERRCRARVQFVLDVLEFVLLAGGARRRCTAIVPNTPVRWAHAWPAALFAAAGHRTGQARCWPGTCGLVPTYSVVYGAFATVPILLVWIYVAWLIVLLGAVIAAYLPSLLGRRRAGAPTAHGWQFQLALEVLQQLHARAQLGAAAASARRTGARAGASTRCSWSRCWKRWCSWTGSAA